MNFRKKKKIVKGPRFTTSISIPLELAEFMKEENISLSKIVIGRLKSLRGRKIAEQNRLKAELEINAEITDFVDENAPEKIEDDLR